jgi:hypothetical protein
MSSSCTKYALISRVSRNLDPGLDRSTKPERCNNAHHNYQLKALHFLDRAAAARSTLPIDFFLTYDRHMLEHVRNFSPLRSTWGPGYVKRVSSYSFMKDFEGLDSDSVRRRVGAVDGV